MTVVANVEIDVCCEVKSEVVHVTIYSLISRLLSSFCCIQYVREGPEPKRLFTLTHTSMCDFFFGLCFSIYTVNAYGRVHYRSTEDALEMVLKL